jgi:hypothetical protein
MRLFYCFVFNSLLTDACAQIPDFSATLEQNQLPVVASELPTLVANQVLTSQDAQQLLLFFEPGKFLMGIVCALST